MTRHCLPTGSGASPPRARSGASTADVAFTVADEWQGRGLGSLLGKHLVHSARGRDIRRFTATMASDNLPAQRLLAKMTKHLEQHHAGGGVDELVLDLAA
jgi:GNAT superfamily N-acetyltransferase